MCRTSCPGGVPVIVAARRRRGPHASSRPPGRWSCCGSRAVAPARTAPSRRSAGRRRSRYGRRGAWWRPPSPASGWPPASRKRVAATNGSSCTSLARPSSTARVPLTTSPVIVSRFATSIRTCWDSAWIPPMSGMSPHFASSTDHWASAVVIRRSAARAIWRPPP